MKCRRHHQQQGHPEQGPVELRRQHMQDRVTAVRQRPPRVDSRANPASRTTAARRSRSRSIGAEATFNVDGEVLPLRARPLHAAPRRISGRRRMNRRWPRRDRRLRARRGTAASRCATAASGATATTCAARRSRPDPDAFLRAAEAITSAPITHGNTARDPRQRRRDLPRLPRRDRRRGALGEPPQLRLLARRHRP